MNGREINLTNSTNLTSSGINKFIKARLLNLEENPVVFKISYYHKRKLPSAIFKGLNVAKSIEELNSKPGVVLLDSNKPNYKLRVEYSGTDIRGKTIRTAFIERSYNHFNSVRCVAIRAVSMNEFLQYELSIEEKNQSSCQLLFDNACQIQRKIIEEFEKINYIKQLLIWDTSYDWKFCPENRQISVGKITLWNGNYVLHYLRQIDPSHLKEVYISGLTGREEGVYDMPQIIHTEKLTVSSNCNIRDYQLLQLNTISLELDVGNHNNLTSSGINAFIKKCLLKLGDNDYNFHITFPNDMGDSFSHVHDGLDIFSSDTTAVGRDGRIYVANSPFPEFKLRLKIYSRFLIGERIRRNE